MIAQIPAGMAFLRIRSMYLSSADLNFLEHCFEENDMLHLKFKLRFTLTGLFLLALLLFFAYPLYAQSGLSEFNA